MRDSSIKNQTATGDYRSTERQHLLYNHRSNGVYRITEANNVLTVWLKLNGCQREDIAAFCSSEAVTVYFLHNSVNEKGYIIIVLPAAVDADFVSGQYSPNVLKIHLPKLKAGDRPLSESREIVIY